MTIYVQIKDKPDELPTPGQWFPWTECKSEDETVLIAAHRWIRSGGYANKGVTFKPFPVFIFSFDSTQPMNKAGDQPLTCNRTHFVVHPR